MASIWDLYKQPTLGTTTGIQVSTSRCYLPTQAANGNTFKVYGEYEIGG